MLPIVIKTLVQEQKIIPFGDTEGHIIPSGLVSPMHVSSAAIGG